jgi:hypothetical protein
MNRDYVGYKFIEFDYGVARDASISPVLRPIKESSAFGLRRVMM